LICHHRFNPFPVATLAPDVRLSTLLSLLIPAVGSLPLFGSGFGSTVWTTVALTTVAANANHE